MISAAGSVPFQLRSAVKMKPRNRNSSQIGAITHVSPALSSSSVVLSFEPSCSRIFSFSGLTASDQTTRQHDEYDQQEQEQAAARRQPAAGRRRPNCHAATPRPPSWAK